MVGTPIDVLANASDPDGDELTINWELFAPDGSTPSWSPSADIADAYRLVPDVAGVYEVRITADDGTDLVDETLPIEVDADVPPCLDTLDPAPAGIYQVDRDGGIWDAKVGSVIDDLDPWTQTSDEWDFLGETAFAWKVASPDTGGELVPVAGLDGPLYQLDPSIYAPGDSVQIQVEIADRVDRTLPCAADAATCSIAGDSCLQRVTWEVEIR
ncbi:MAG TPA: hypothetical protein VL172_12770 [Kofleriaceae bacterium]|nr:hypothetical protein [Kofleriaceae bacterium]